MQKQKVDTAAAQKGIQKECPLQMIISLLAYLIMYIQKYSDLREEQKATDEERKRVRREKVLQQEAALKAKKEKAKVDVRKTVFKLSFMPPIPPA